MSSQHITRFRWVISKLTNKTLDDLPETQIISEEFPLIKSRVKLNMKFKPNYVAAEGANKRYCSLCINLVDLDGRDKVKINYSLWIENNEGYAIVGKPVIRNSFRIMIYVLQGKVQFLVIKLRYVAKSGAMISSMNSS
jgi:hypothetical protein